MMDGRLLEHPHAQFGGSLGGVVGFPYPLGHHHVYELAGHQLQSAASVPFSIDGLLSGSCAAAASVVNPTPLLPAACGVGGDSQPFKLSGRRSGRGVWTWVGVGNPPGQRSWISGGCGKGLSRVPALHPDTGLAAALSAAAGPRAAPGAAEGGGFGSGRG